MILKKYKRINAEEEKKKEDRNEGKPKIFKEK